MVLVEAKQRWNWRFIGWFLSILNFPGVEGKSSSSKEGIFATTSFGGFFFFLNKTRNWGKILQMQREKRKRTDLFFLLHLLIRGREMKGLYIVVTHFRVNTR